MNNRRKKFKTSKPFYSRKWFQRGCLGLVSILILGYVMVLSPIFQFNDLIIQGNQRIDSNEIREIALAHLEQRFGQSLVWPIGDLASGIKDYFPYVKDIEVHRRWPKSIIIILNEKEPRYCLESDSSNWLLDSEGSYLESIGECPREMKSLLIDPLDQDDFVNNIMPIVNEIDAKISLFPELNLRSLRIDDSKIELTMENPKPGQPEWGVYLDRSFEISGQLYRLSLFLQTRELDDIARLEYVDVGGHQERVYYVERD